MTLTRRFSLDRDVRAIQEEVARAGYSSMRAAELLTVLAALSGECADVSRDAEHAYHLEYLVCLDVDRTVARAKARAQTTPAFLTWREALDRQQLVTELMRALRQYLRTTSDERFASRQLR